MYDYLQALQFINIFRIVLEFKQSVAPPVAELGKKL